MSDARFWFRTQGGTAVAVVAFLAFGELLRFAGVGTELASKVSFVLVGVGFTVFVVSIVRRVDRFLGHGPMEISVPLFGPRPLWLGAVERAKGSLAISAGAVQRGELSDASAGGELSMGEPASEIEPAADQAEPSQPLLLK
ncbi:MAG: hypothetical protein HYV07_07140 [Deltaproteobacteria bacterium]|nr:hypothetical protein [Deltaproteobacteria bacterium]